jgi:hypothetical protein
MVLFSTIDMFQREERMRRPEKQIVDPRKLLTILAKALVGRLGTIGPNGPMIKPVNPLLYDGAIYFHSSPVGEKIEHIMNDPRVCFAVDEETIYHPATTDPCEASFDFRSVIVTGNATFITDPGVKTDILNRLMNKFQPDGPCALVTPELSRGVAVVKITIDAITGKVSPPPHADDAD